MVIDIVNFIQATTRLVTTRMHDGQPAKVLVASRNYATDMADLWDALTSADRIPNWFLPVSGDLKLGGRFQLEGNAGGEVLVCEPHHHFYITWEFGGQVSWVDISLTAVAGGTQLVLEHTAFVPDEMWDQYGPGAVGIGWEMGLLGLDIHVTTKNPRTAKEGMVWVASDEGKAFIRACSDEWCAASVASGTPEDAAREAATRCAAAYTGEA